VLYLKLTKVFCWTRSDFTNILFVIMTVVTLEDGSIVDLENIENIQIPDESDTVSTNPRLHNNVFEYKRPCDRVSSTYSVFLTSYTKSKGPCLWLLPTRRYRQWGPTRVLPCRKPPSSLRRIRLKLLATRTGQREYRFHVTWVTVFNRWELRIIQQIPSSGE
jgi:hypothetical protein